MISSIDERRGMSDLCWAQMRERVAKVEPELARLIDELDPDDTFRVFLAYYPYGELISDTEQPYFPRQDGSVYKITDPYAPAEVIKHLGYGAGSSPLTLVLEKKIEFYIDFAHKKLTVPLHIFSPGTIYPFSTISSDRKRDRLYAPTSVLTLRAGVRSVFMLPNIGCVRNFERLQRDFNIHSLPPEYLCDHWGLFKELFNSEAANCEWQTCIMFFSEKWLDKLHNDPAWMALSLYLLKKAWRRFEFPRNYHFYQIFFSAILHECNLKPNPYLVDTVQHLFATVLGFAPGYIPACDNEGLPRDFIQSVMDNSYRLKKYLPIIMQPTHFDFASDSSSIYYGLSYPATFASSPRSRVVTTTLSEMREIAYVMGRYINQFSKSSTMGSDTIFKEIAGRMDINYFHNKFDPHGIIHPTTEIFKADPRFLTAHNGNQAANRGFASNAEFLRGCISIKIKP
jgi:hypothetical protein